jgi:fibro-slime domain-containing protein
MGYKITLDSTQAFSTSNFNPYLLSNKKYAIDFSFLPENKNYALTFNFTSKNILNGLTYTIYNGYFNGTNASPNISWFNTAQIRSSGITIDLTSLESITNGAIFNNASGSALPNAFSIKISGSFRASKTGTYRFFTRSDDASFLYINNTSIVANGGTHAPQDAFGNVNMVAGTYYNIDIYYGDSSQGQWLSVGFIDPDGNITSINPADFTTNGYNRDVFYINTTTLGQFNSLIAIDFNSPFSQNYIGSNITQRRNTTFAGILQVKQTDNSNGILYSHPKINHKIFLERPPSGNFIDISIYDMDAKTLSQINTDYLMTLNFEEVE